MVSNNIPASSAALQQALGIFLNNTSLLEQALTHSSYTNEIGGQNLDSNERLEFLGDAILDYVIADKLYQDHPHLTEGQMTRLRAALVRRDSLARIARSINLGSYLRLGKGEESSGGRDKPTNLAGALEAVIASILLDQGLPATRAIIITLFNEELQKITSLGSEMDYKSRLQEIAQARHQLAPTYQVVETTGPAHNRIFTVEVSIGDIILGKGSGTNKKSAETEAARLAIQRLSTPFTP